MDEVKFRYGKEVRFANNVEETRTIEFIISDNSKDRHGTVLPIDGWKIDNFNKNGIVGYQHNVHGGDMCTGPDPDCVIGKGRAYREGDKLIGEVIFEPADLNPLAEKIFRKVLFGSLRATSVGFLPIGKGEWGKGEQAVGGSDPTYYYAGQELLEFSIVNIPSNPNAVGRSIRDQTHNALLYVKRVLGEDYSFSKIEAMTVGEILKQLPGSKKRELETEELPEHPADMPEVKDTVEEKQEDIIEDNTWALEQEQADMEAEVLRLQ